MRHLLHPDQRPDGRNLPQDAHTALSSLGSAVTRLQGAYLAADPAPTGTTTTPTPILPAAVVEAVSGGIFANYLLYPFSQPLGDVAQPLVTMPGWSGDGPCYIVLLRMPPTIEGAALLLHSGSGDVVGTAHDMARWVPPAQRPACWGVST